VWVVGPAVGEGGGGGGRPDGTGGGGDAYAGRCAWPLDAPRCAGVAQCYKTTPTAAAGRRRSEGVGSVEVCSCEKMCEGGNARAQGADGQAFGAGSGARGACSVCASDVCAQSVGPMDHGFLSQARHQTPVQHSHMEGAADVFGSKAPTASGSARSGGGEDAVVVAWSEEMAGGRAHARVSRTRCCVSAADARASSKGQAPRACNGHGNVPHDRYKYLSLSSS